MDKQKKVEHWAYPFKLKGAGTQGFEAQDPRQYYEALAKALGGFYPMATNGSWHGGIHFDKGTGDFLDQSSVRCIADGQVIAYRIDESAPITEYFGEHMRVVQAPYSRGLVLVKHRLELPSNNSDQVKDAPPVGELTFYSLYMHLLDWAGYLKDDAPQPAAFFGPITYSPKAEKVVDHFLGASTRAGAPGTPGHRVKNALLPKGAKIRTAESAPAPNGKWKKLSAILDGNSFPQTIGEAWIDTGELEAVGSDTYLVSVQSNDYNPELLPGKGLNVYSTARGKQRNSITAVLPQGVKLTLEEGSGEYRKISTFTEGTSTSPLTTESSKNIHGYVAISALQAQPSKPVTDIFHLLPEPYDIKAGEVVGHLGPYQNASVSEVESLLHLEIFSCDDVPAFIGKSRSLAKTLEEKQKPLLKIHKGASRLIEHKDGISAQNPPDICMKGSIVGVDLIVPQRVLEDLPITHQLTDTKTFSANTPPQVTHWWRLENLLADEEGKPISGWLAEQDLITTRHSPWEWEGFDFIEEHGKPVDHLAHLLDARRLLSDEERENYRAKISQADTGPIKQRLYDIIDTNKDNKFSLEEIHFALGKLWHAQSISQLMTRYESEWFWDAEKWDELDPLLNHTPSQPNLNWANEKKRIEKLSWWKDSGLPGDGKAWHFHLVGLLGNFTCPADDNDLKWLKVPCGQLTFDVEGNDFEDAGHPLHRYFSRVVHWPQGVSGVTVGRGYDLGQQADPRTDLTNAGVKEPLLSWLVGAKGKQGQAAKTYLDSATKEIRQHTITRKQQYLLFANTYEFMRADILRVSGTISNQEKYGALQWDSINKKIQDIIIDLRYRGDYHVSSRKFIQEPFVKNNLEKIKQEISRQSNWESVPPNRFFERTRYLESQ
ncbi:pesticin C-terminus-like muramidase [Pseudomonas sp. MWU13-2100]|uniref:pesticin C-terminus-like muramidase n=1 Tax=Pseudomonas sp. MWU13-2100 TaxID=2935075 RepID=UPI00200D5810|nr:pesticin C-terminus-like muramidase [Pseudomonas sp. MWU13-2100]